ncbi:MAG TPA: sugar phosphate isomerase/epimerase family protein [Steroidobacteraceae bacterium]|nr:sugar phosphate isomerase/epimerase family protein [Steroidobacteraceae bacterium]
MRDFSSGIEWLSINTATVRRQWKLPQIIEACARHGIAAISPWRDQVAECGLDVASRLIRETGTRLSGYCRGGMFPAVDEAGLSAAMEDNFRAVDEACELGSPCLVLVVGGLPGALEGRAAHRDIGCARAQVIDGIAQLLEYSRPRNMPLAIEPLHPMYAADRACVNTLEQALDICDALDPANAGALGVVVDIYHTWWDPKLHEQIRRAGARRLLGFHVCDWLTPTTDLLLDRGMMGDGVIDIRRIRTSMEAAGYAGFSEVEIFSANNWWQRPGDEVLATCIERHRGVV